MEKLWGEGSAAKQDVLRRDNGIRAAENTAGGLFLPSPHPFLSFFFSFAHPNICYRAQHIPQPVLPAEFPPGTLPAAQGEAVGTCVLGKAFWER